MADRYGDEKVDPSPLGQPLHFEFANRTAPNRFLKAAMTERLSTWDRDNLQKRGIPTPELINVYRRWGEGALGTILTGNIMVDLVNLEAMGNPIIPGDAPFEGERFEAFKELASAAKAHGSLIIGQMSHPGRQVESRLQDDPVSASDVQLDKEVLGMQFAKPHPASDNELQQIIDAFVHSAEYLQKAGYDGIELHGAHGYLLAQFLAPSTNHRNDSYGGSLQNRSRIISEIARSIRRKVPASTGFILGIKLNSVEFQDSGFSTEECRDLCSALENDCQFDFVELSGGTYENLSFHHRRDSTRKREGFFLEFAEKIVPALKKTKVFITGGMRSVSAMVKALDTVHGVGLARPICQEPHLCRDILEGKVTMGAIKQKPNQDDFGITNVAAGTQIRQVGRDQAPLDLSKDENMEVFQKSMEKWGKEMQEDAKKMNKYGYVDLIDIQPKPYTTVA